MNYNERQLEAINSQDSKVLVTAPAGSGKTSTLVGAIHKFAQDNPTSNIVAITFTRKAAAELQSRLIGYNATTATIHSWSLKELNKLAMEHQFKVNILQDAQIQELLVELAKQCGYFTMNYFMLFSYVMGNYNMDIKVSTKSKFDKVLRTYISYKRSNKLYDFTDLPLYLFDMLNYYHEEIENIDGLFVDEFQDVDDIQAQIFTKVKAKKYFYIGDVDQSIYIFRGAGPHNLTNLEGFTHYKLNINYRSYQSIIDFSTQIHTRDVKNILSIKGLAPSDIICARQENPGIVDIQEGSSFYNPVKDRYYSLYEALSFFMLKKTYILCRTNKQVKAIQAMGYNNVSTIHQAKGLEYTNVIVVDFAIMNDEDRNIAYVACTRARDGLMVLEFETIEDYLPDILTEFNNEILGCNLF